MRIHVTSRIILIFIFVFKIVFIICVDGQRSGNRLSEASGIAVNVQNYFTRLFGSCVETTISSRFMIDDIYNNVNNPSKTTVGTAPIFTKNRKFFTNMIGTVAFERMIANDKELIRRSLYKKAEFCDEAIMDSRLIRDVYNFEIDPSKN